MVCTALVFPPEIEPVLRKSSHPLRQFFPPIRKTEDGYEVGSLEAILLELDSTDTGDEDAPNKK